MGKEPCSRTHELLALTALKGFYKWQHIPCSGHGNNPGSRNKGMNRSWILMKWRREVSVTSVLAASTWRTYPI